MHLECLLELHAGLKQQGPGSDASTLRALASIPPDRRIDSILDAGCGPGRQTLTLARATDATVLAIDLNAGFLRELEQRASAAGLAHRIRARALSMDAVGREHGPFDLIWSEGAIYHIGFSSGLEYWRTLLSDAGWVAVTELSWLGGERPAAASDFWRDAYPDMHSADENAAIARAAGFQVHERFPLPSEDFWTDYYTPLRARIPALRKKWEHDADACRQLQESEREIALYEHFGDSFGYVFYVLEAI